jgi:hypothetical protein
MSEKCQKQTLTTGCASALVMVRGLNERVHLPNLVGRKAKTKGRHLRPLATVDHRCEELFVAEFCTEDVRSARASASMTNQALAPIDIATGRNGIGLTEKRIAQALPCIRDLQQTEEQSCETEDEASSN